MSVDRPSVPAEEAKESSRHCVVALPSQSFGTASLSPPGFSHAVGVSVAPLASYSVSSPRASEVSSPRMRVKVKRTVVTVQGAEGGGDGEAEGGGG